MLNSSIVSGRSKPEAQRLGRTAFPRKKEIFHLPFVAFHFSLKKLRETVCSQMTNEKFQWEMGNVFMQLT